RVHAEDGVFLHRDTGLFVLEPICLEVTDFPAPGDESNSAGDVTLSHVILHDSRDALEAFAGKPRPVRRYRADALTGDCRRKQQRLNDQCRACDDSHESLLVVTDYLAIDLCLLSSLARLKTNRPPGRLNFFSAPNVCQAQ